jgi:hypothetical protein
VEHLIFTQQRVSDAMSTQQLMIRSFLAGRISVEEKGKGETPW